MDMSFKTFYRWGGTAMRKKLALAAVLGAFVLVGGLPGDILGRVGR